METNEAFFTARDFMALTGISRTQIDYWHSAGVLVPSVMRPAGYGTRRIYNFSDAVTARIGKELRDAGVSLKNTAKVLKEFRKRDCTVEPGKTHLIVSGKDVELRDRSYLLSLRRNNGHQTHFALDLRKTINALKKHASTLKVA